MGSNRARAAGHVPMARPSGTEISTTRAKPMATRVSVAWMSVHSSPPDASSPRARSTAAGDGR